MAAKFNVSEDSLTSDGSQLLIKMILPSAIVVEWTSIKCHHPIGSPSFQPLLFSTVHTTSERERERELTVMDYEPSCQLV